MTQEMMGAHWQQLNHIQIISTLLLTNGTPAPHRSLAAHCKAQGLCAISCAKKAEPIQVCWDVDSDRSKPACVRWGTHWRHLVNTTEPCM